MCIKEIFGCILVKVELPKHLYGIEKKDMFLKEKLLKYQKWVSSDLIIPILQGQKEKYSSNH